VCGCAFGGVHAYVHLCACVCAFTRKYIQVYTRAYKYIQVYTSVYAHSVPDKERGKEDRQKVT